MKKFNVLLAGVVYAEDVTEDKAEGIKRWLVEIDSIDPSSITIVKRKTTISDLLEMLEGFQLIG